MIHRAILGSLERFMGILIENYAGRLADDSSAVPGSRVMCLVSTWTAAVLDPCVCRGIPSVVGTGAVPPCACERRGGRVRRWCGR